MIIGTRKTIWPWPADVGVNRDFINGFWVEWAGIKPTDKEVSGHCTPTPDVVANADKQAAKDAMTHTTPLVRLMRSSDRVTYQSVAQVRQAFNGLLAILAQGRFPTTQEATALQLPIRTWAQLKQATQNAIDTEDPTN